MLDYCFGRREVARPVLVHAPLALFGARAKFEQSSMQKIAACLFSDLVFHEVLIIPSEALRSRTVYLWLEA